MTMLRYLCIITSALAVTVFSYETCQDITPDIKRAKDAFQAGLQIGMANCNSQQDNGDQQLQKLYPRNCSEAHQMEPRSGLFTLHIPQQDGSVKVVPSYCYYSSNKESWLVLMRRTNDVDNNRFFPDKPWEKYKSGFGNLLESFWFGLENMYLLTKDEARILRVDLEDWEGESRYAEYGYFSVSSEAQGYRLFVDRYNGTAGDSLSYHNGQAFSTKETDNDNYSGNCARNYNGAWWFNACLYSSLTGSYQPNGITSQDYNGIIWYHWKGKAYSYKIAELKIKF